MSHALTRYHVLYESVRSRRRRPELPKGLDLVYSRAAMKVRESRVTLAYLRREAEAVDALAPALRPLGEEALDAQVRAVRDLFVRGRARREHVRQALAVTREVARRQTGEEAFVVQLMGALALWHGRVAEMLTGEGKTLTGSIVAPLLAWKHRFLHVFTVNDYLAQRDAESRGRVYRRLGLEVGAIVQELEPAERFDVYARPIVYGTPKQIVADWLRDQLRLGRAGTAWAARQQAALEALGAGGGGGVGGGAGAGPMIPGLKAALVDEADAVLIDEGVVPLIIARARREDDMAGVYVQASVIASRLDEGPDYSIDYVKRRAELKRRGRHRCAQFFDDLPEPIWRTQRRAEELVRQALVAKHCYLLGRQYHVVEGRIVIVDEYTGRFLHDRNWEFGLHQAVEAKEGLQVTADRETLARLSFQRFYRSYPFLCGMTGTAADATAEIEKVYSRPVTLIPTNRPLIRRRWPMRVFRTGQGKWNAIVDSVRSVQQRGRPVLVGTRSIAASEHLSRLLSERGVEHRVLNALHDKEEADLIAHAGRGGGQAAVTVATNMAGRGTDIILERAAREAGGLHVILTEMHGAMRIDRQFIGRAGRQGDPGSSQVFVSLEDELIRRHAAPLARMLRVRLRPLRARPAPEAAAPVEPPEPPGPDELEAGALAPWAFRQAQRASEGRERLNRAQVLRQDDWIDKHMFGQ